MVKSILYIALAAVLLISGVGLDGDGLENAEALRNGHLDRYCYSRGGDMNGSHYCEEISLGADGYVLLSISSASWYGEDPSVSEYILDGGVLEEIEAVFRANNMQRWVNRQFTDMFIADGASYSYDFRFGDAYFGFSSQYYPGPYALPLDRIDDIIDRYRESGEKLPGLVRTQSGTPEQGRVTFEVYKYCGGRLYCRLTNNALLPVVLPSTMALFNAETGEEIPVTNSRYVYENEVGRGESCEEDTLVNERLAPGRYRLEAGKFSAGFVIG